MATTQAGDVGTLVSLWWYPVKSMLGEELNAADITERGLLGDRAYALVDQSTMKIVSAKRPRRWGQLFDFRAALVEPTRSGEALPQVRITFPDGTTTTTEHTNLSQLLTDVLGHQVQVLATAPAAAQLDEYWPSLTGLAPLGEPVSNAEGDTITALPVAFAAPAGTFFDVATIHLVTTATLNRLRELYPAGRFEVRRFRPNLVVAPPAGREGFIENDWVGRTLAVGEAVRLKVSMPCPRCVMTTLPQADLPQDTGILRAVAQHNQVPVGDFGDMGCVGVYADVVQGGVIRQGDSVRLE